MPQIYWLCAPKIKAIRDSSVSFAVSIHSSKQKLVPVIVQLTSNWDHHHVGQRWRTRDQSHVQLDNGHTDFYVAFHQDLS